MHFAAPERFAIWDSRIYGFLHGRTAHNYRVNNVARYREYQATLASTRADTRFPAFHASVNAKLGYDVSALRAIELVMFLNSSADREPAP